MIFSRSILTLALQNLVVRSVEDRKKGKRCRTASWIHSLVNALTASSGRYRNGSDAYLRGQAQHWHLACRHRGVAAPETPRHVAVSEIVF